MKNGKVVNEYGNIRYYKDDKLHREDGPAIEWSSGSKEWYLNGKRHRKDGPAVEYASGSKSWYLNGECHRIDGPAIEWSDGDKYWYLNGKYYTEKNYWIKLQELQLGIFKPFFTEEEFKVC